MFLGVLRMSCKFLGCVLEVSGRCQRASWMLTGRCLEEIFQIQNLFGPEIFWTKICLDKKIQISFWTWSLFRPYIFGAWKLNFRTFLRKIWTLLKNNRFLCCQQKLFFFIEKFRLKWIPIWLYSCRRHPTIDSYNH